MKKITLITQFFPPDYAATGQLLDRLTIRLSSEKIRFRIICGLPFYAFKNNKLSRFEYNKNRLIIRTRLSTLFKKNFFGRLSNSILFIINSIHNLFFILSSSDLIVFTTEPPFAPFISLLTFFLKRTKYILIIYDSYPNILFENKLINKENIIIKLWLFLNKFVYLNSEKIIMLSSSMASKFVEDFPYTKNKISIISSWADVNQIKPLLKKENWFVKKHGIGDKFVVMYSGNQGRCHDLKTILDTALHLKHNKKIIFLFIGNGYQNKMIKEFKSYHDLKNIKLLDYQPYENLPFSLTAADLALVTISENSENLIAPSKLYGHLAAGTPIGVISPANSYLEDLVISNQIGISFLNGESIKLKEWIICLDKDKELQMNYSRNAREFIMKNFTEEIISKKYYDLINEIIED